MKQAATRYFTELSEVFGRNWNRFWFTPGDPLPLGVIRVITGLVALWWYLTLAPDFTRLFGEGGWLPLDTVRQVEGNLAKYEWSYFDFFRATNELWVVYALGVLPLLALIVGWHTRISSVLALVTVLATAHRAPMISTPAEPVLTMMLLYLCLGPSGACLSLDARRARAAAVPCLPAPAKDYAAPSTGARIATRLLQVHLALLYGFMGLSKLFAGSWWNGTAVWFLIVRSESRLVDLTSLHSHPFLVNFWTHAIVLFELAFAVLIWVRLARPLLLVLAVFVLGSVTVLTGQTTLLVLMLTANLAFVPADVLRGCVPATARAEVA